MKIEWEKISAKELRTKVFGGWIVKTTGSYIDPICFVPDQNYEWKIDDWQKK